MKSGQPDRAETLYREVVDYYTRLSSVDRRAGAVTPLRSLHLLHWNQMHLGKAADALERSIELADAAGWMTPEQRAAERRQVEELRAWAAKAGTRELVEYSPPDPPGSFDLIAIASPDGQFMVDGHPHDFDAMVALVNESAAQTVVVKFDRPVRGIEDICPSLLGLATNTHVYVQKQNGRPVGVELHFPRKTIESLTRDCRAPLTLTDTGEQEG